MKYSCNSIIHPNFVRLCPMPPLQASPLEELLIRPFPSEAYYPDFHIMPVYRIK